MTAFTYVTVSYYYVAVGYVWVMLRYRMLPRGSLLGRSLRVRSRNLPVGKVTRR